MKLIINTSNIVIGGGIQVSLSFLSQLKLYEENEYHVFLSKQVDVQLDRADFGNNFNFYIFDQSPSGFIKGARTKKLLSSLEKKINPDLVFTVFGPAYWMPEFLHITGFADGWCYTPNSIAFNNHSIKKKIRLHILISIKKHFIKKANFLIVETETAKRNIILNMKISPEKIYVVGNTYHQVFNTIEPVKKERSKDTFQLLVLSSFYKHKNLQIINEVVKILRRKSKVLFKFYLTISPELFKNNFQDEEYIINVGPQNIIDCPQLYKNADALFLPTLLETFTANYPEAMVMETPILTSDLDFARELCGNAALFFDPLSPEEIADKIIALQSDKILQNKLIERGKVQLEKFETAESRTSKYLSIFEKIINTEKLIQ